MTSLVSLKLEADLTRDGSWDTDLTPYTGLNAGRTRIARGMDDDGYYQVSSMEFGLDDPEGDFAPEWDEATYYGVELRRCPVRLTATHSGRSYTLWTGYIDDVVHERGRVSLSAQDIAGYLSDSLPIHLTVSQSRDTDGAIAAIATALGLSADDLDLTDGEQALPLHYVMGQDAMTAMMDAATSEMGGILDVSGVGRLRFRGRRFRRGVSRYRQEVLALKPVGYWRLGMGSGAALDESGNNLTGVANGAPTYGVEGLLTGDPDRAVTLEPGSYFAAADNALLDITGGLTLACWVRFDSVQNATVSLLDKGGGGVYFLRHGDNGEGNVLQFFVSTGGGTVEPRVASPTAVEADTTYFVTATYDGANLRLYIDGELVATQARTGTLDTNNSPLYLGAGQQGLDGTLDECAVWNRALSADEVRTLYRVGAGMDWRWGDDTLVQPEDVRYLLDPYDSVQSVRLRQTVYRTGQADELVWLSSQNMRTRPTANSEQFAAGEERTTYWNATAAVLAFTEPVAGVDWIGNSLANGSGTDRTSDFEYEITDLGGGYFSRRVKNTSGSSAYLAWSQVRGQKAQFFSDRPEQFATKSVPGLGPDQGMDVDLPWTGPAGMLPLRYTYQLLRTYRRAFPRVELELPWDNDDTIAAMLAAEIGDLVWFADGPGDGNPAWVTNVADHWYIERIEHEPQPGGMSRSTVLLLPSYVYRDLDRCVFDTFERDDASGDLGTSTSGTAWADDGGFDIVSGKARPSSSATKCSIDLGTGATDQVVEVDLADIGANDEVGVCFRWADTNNQYRAWLDADDDLLVLEANVAGSASTIESVAFAVGEAHELRVMVQGTRIRVWVDGVRRIDVEDDSLRDGTRVGLFARDASGETTFDDFYGQGV